MAVDQNQWYHFGGASILVYVSGWIESDVLLKRTLWIVTHGHLFLHFGLRLPFFAPSRGPSQAENDAPKVMLRQRLKYARAPFETQRSG